jgi:hypothetical protein
LSVARQFRSTLEQLTGEIPDIVMLGIGLAVIAWAISPTLKVATQVRNLVGTGPGAVIS